MFYNFKDSISDSISIISVANSSANLFFSSNDIFYSDSINYNFLYLSSFALIKELALINLSSSNLILSKYYLISSPKESINFVFSLIYSLFLSIVSF